MDQDKRAVIWSAVSTERQTDEEKYSLPAQTADARAVCELKNWRVVDVLEVPGFSRSGLDIHEIAEEARLNGIFAFHKILEHWEKKDFDVLVVRDGDRFARSQTLFAYFVERTIREGAELFIVREDKLVTRLNHRDFTAYEGRQAANDIDKLVCHHKRGFDKRAERGLPVSSRLPLSHKLRRDSNGKAEILEVNEARRPLWDDLALLILEGVAWDRIEHELLHRYGHVDENNRKFHTTKMYRLVMKPVFWGHSARNHNSATSQNGFRLGEWIYDESCLPPDGVKIYRNTHEPVWTGEQAEAVKAELRRRSEAVIGSASPETTHRFSGLAICGECSSFMATHQDKNYRCLLCPNAKSKSHRFAGRRCRSTKSINEKKILTYLDNLIGQLLSHGSGEIFGEAEDAFDLLRNRLADTDIEIKKLEMQLRNLIRAQSQSDENTRAYYDEEIAPVGKRLDILKRSRVEIESSIHSRERQTAAEHKTLDELVEMSMKTFWQQEPRYINQILHRLMGKKRFVILNGHIEGVAVSTKRQRRHT